MIRVLFFGPIAERIGARQIQVNFRTGLRWTDVRDELRTSHPDAIALVAIVAVDGVRVTEENNAPLTDGAEVVFMSAFSGG
jgi:molybdopterin converting factor small subunit